jgi:tRNA(fMet)-specific endonuclease VapC
MTTRYVLDTNILTALLRHETQSVEHTTRAAAANAEILLCPVVFYEALRGLLHRDAQKQKQHLLDYAAVFIWEDFDRADWGKAAELWATLRKAAELWATLRKQGMQVSDADLLIGVYAMQRQAIVITANEKHFVPLAVQTENWLI